VTEYIARANGTKGFWKSDDFKYFTIKTYLFTNRRLDSSDGCFGGYGY